MVTYRNDLSVTPGGKTLRIYLSQNDANFSLIFDLYSTVGVLNIQSGSTVKLQGRHRNEKAFEVNGSISGTTVTVSGAKAITECPGEAVAELVITHSDKKLATANFILMIEPKA